MCINQNFASKSAFFWLCFNFQQRRTIDLSICLFVYLDMSVSANPSFRSTNCPYLSVGPVRFGVAVDPPIGSPVHLSTSTRLSRVIRLATCVYVHAYLLNMFLPIYAFAFTCLIKPSLVFLFIANLFALVRSLTLHLTRGLNWPDGLYDSFSVSLESSASPGDSPS